ncbi:hypothetical protein C0J52_06290 [Blattella germanica]|nr:hypothetical protein C0J52_06290 [Blattella germanica]
MPVFESNALVELLIRLECTQKSWRMKAHKRVGIYTLFNSLYAQHRYLGTSETEAYNLNSVCIFFQAEKLPLQPLLATSCIFYLGIHAQHTCMVCGGEGEGVWDKKRTKGVLRKICSTGHISRQLLEGLDAPRIQEEFHRSHGPLAVRCRTILSLVDPLQTQVFRGLLGTGTFVQHTNRPVLSNPVGNFRRIDPHR